MTNMTHIRDGCRTTLKLRARQLVERAPDDLVGRSVAPLPLAAVDRVDLELLAEHQHGLLPQREKMVSTVRESLCGWVRHLLLCEGGHEPRGEVLLPVPAVVALAALRLWAEDPVVPNAKSSTISRHSKHA